MSKLWMKRWKLSKRWFLRVGTGPLHRRIITRKSAIPTVEDPEGSPIGAPIDGVNRQRFAMTAGTAETVVGTDLDRQQAAAATSIRPPSGIVRRMAESIAVANGHIHRENQLVTTDLPVHNVAISTSIAAKLRGLRRQETLRPEIMTAVVVVEEEGVGVAVDMMNGTRCPHRRHHLHRKDAGEVAIGTRMTGGTTSGSHRPGEDSTMRSVVSRAVAAVADRITQVRCSRESGTTTTRGVTGTSGIVPCAVTTTTSVAHRVAAIRPPWAVLLSGEVAIAVRYSKTTVEVAATTELPVVEDSAIGTIPVHRRRWTGADVSIGAVRSVGEEVPDVAALRGAEAAEVASITVAMDMKRTTGRDLPVVEAGEVVVDRPHHRHTVHLPGRDHAREMEVDRGDLVPVVAESARRRCLRCR